MTKAQILKQLNLPEAANDLKLVIETHEKINTQGFLIYEDFNVTQVIPGESVKGKVDKIVL
jgi:hypothetical protein